MYGNHTFRGLREHNVGLVDLTNPRRNDSYCCIFISDGLDSSFDGLNAAVGRRREKLIEQGLRK